MSKANVLITGVSQRIGLHLAQSLINSGYHVIGLYRTMRPGVEKLQESGAELYQLDLYQNENVDLLISQLQTKHSALRCIIHNASEWISDKVYDASTFDKLFQIHVHVPYKLNMALVPMLRDSDSEFADIIHFSDYAASIGSAKHSAYAASKAALDNLTLSFATRFAPKIKVNSIAPGLILFNEHDTADYRERALQKSLIQREGGVEEIEQAVSYLLESRFVTGRVLPVDGGRHLVKKKC